MGTSQLIQNAPPLRVLYECMCVCVCVCVSFVFLFFLPPSPPHHQLALYGLQKSSSKPVEVLHAKEARIEKGRGGMSSSGTTTTTNSSSGSSSNNKSGSVAVMRKLRVSARRPGTLAAACDDGSVLVWALSSRLRDAAPSEHKRMEAMVNELFSAS